MELILKYLFDTYALVELVKNNPNYLKYSDEIVATSIFNLVELAYAVLKDFNLEKSKLVYSKFEKCAIEIPEIVIFDAVTMKLKFKNRNLSYTDCIGYCLALNNNLKFLTGDKEFRHLPNVEFVQ